MEEFIAWATEKNSEDNWNIEIQSKSWLKQVRINFLLKSYRMSWWFFHRSMKRYFPRRKFECPLMTKNTSIPAQISYQKSAKNCINFNLLLFPFYTHWFPYLYFEILIILKKPGFLFIFHQITFILNRRQWDQSRWQFGSLSPQSWSYPSHH